MQTINFMIKVKDPQKIKDQRIDLLDSKMVVRKLSQKRMRTAMSKKQNQLKKRSKKKRRLLLEF